MLRIKFFAAFLLALLFGFACLPNARADEAIQQMGRIVVVADAKDTTELAPTLVKQIVIDEHTPWLALYHSRQDSKFQAAYPWPKFWKETCRLNGIPCTEEAWKKIHVGKKIVVPAGEVRLHVPNGVALPDVLALAPAADGTGHLVVSTELSPPPSANEIALAQSLAAAQSAVTDLSRENRFKDLILFFLAAALVILVVVLVASGKKGTEGCDNYCTQKKRCDSGDSTGGGDCH